MTNYILRGITWTARSLLHRPAGWLSTKLADAAPTKPDGARRKAGAPTTTPAA